MAFGENKAKELRWPDLFATVEGTPVAAACIDYGMNIIDCTSHFAALLGMDRAEMIAKNVSDLTLHDDRAVTAVRFALLEEGEHVATQKHYRCKDGSKVLLSIVAIPMDGWVLDFAWLDWF